MSIQLNEEQPQADTHTNNHLMGSVTLSSTCHWLGPLCFWYKFIPPYDRAA